MIRKLKVVITLMFMLGMAVAPVAAQDFDVKDLDDLGLQGMYGRLYLTEAALTGAPGLMGVMVVGVNFSDASAAEEAFEPLTCGFAGGMFEIDDDGDCTNLQDGGVEITDLDGVGDQAIELIGEIGEGEHAQAILIAATQSENNIFLVIYLGDNTPGLADDFAVFLADADPVDTEVEFDADNNGSGGFFDMLPLDGDDVVEGMIPFEDMDIFSELSDAP